jgi:Protein of unknown function (DUF2934)
MAKPKVPKKTNGDVVTTPSEASAASIESSASQTGSPEPKKSMRQPAIVKGEARATVVPINLDEEIRCLAYLFSERRGFEPGHENDDWLAAEHEVLQRYRQHSA